MSSRREKPLIAMNCAAVPPNMIEGELFGDESRRRQGKFALADGGTLFLDEIDELPLPDQTRLLYLLQPDGAIQAGGGETSVPDVRLIATTSQPLEPLVQERRFRKELFFRLNTITVSLPPLRERQDDIVPIANRFLSVCNEKYHRNVVFSPKIYRDLQKYGWPGNLRELKSYVERAVILSDDSLPVFERAEERDCSESNCRPSRGAHDGEPLSVQLRAFEAEVIQETLASCGGNRTVAIKRLGLSRRTFYRKCAELGILLCGEK